MLSLPDALPIFSVGVGHDPSLTAAIASALERRGYPSIMRSLAQMPNIALIVRAKWALSLNPAMCAASVALCCPPIASNAISKRRHSTYRWNGIPIRSEEHTSELQSLMRISYAVFCLKQKNKTNSNITITQTLQILQ